MTDYMTEQEVMCRLTADLDRVRGERNDAYEAIDDMIDVIGKQIIRIAHDNDDFVCTCCLGTTRRLFRLLKEYAREEDTERIREDWKDITGRDIE